MIDTLIKINEDGILDLLTNEHNDWANLAIDLEDVAFDRPYFREMHWHHIEPDREQLVALWPLEHLAIHICHAWLDSSGSSYAKVAAFVKPHPGRGATGLLSFDNPTLSQKVLSFGQKRTPEQSSPAQELARKRNMKKALSAFLSLPLSVANKHRSRGGQVSGKSAHEQGYGMFALTEKERKNNSSRGGKSVSSHKWMCLQTGHISNAAGLATYQKSRGIDTSKRVRLSPEEVAFIYLWSN